MKTYVYTRARKSNVSFGKMIDENGTSLCVTIELPWKDNARNISCIPEGTYKCEVIYSETKGRVIHIKDVPNRDGILMHVGNTLAETKGCILVGSYWVDNTVRDSKKAMGEVLMTVPDKFMLDIINL
jgi:hypothetical protein